MLLTCRGCQRHLLQAFVGISAVPSSSIVASCRKRTFSKGFASIASRQTTTTVFDDILESQTSDSEIYRNDPSNSKHDRFENEDYVQPSPPAGSREGERPRYKISNTIIQKHLTYLKDPLKLAEFVMQTCMGANGFEKAQAVVRAASKDMQCTVSWNHLINWQMSQGKMNAAIKSYNEMKKRAQTPDSRTYTILIRGCTSHKHPKEGLEKGLAIFRGMQTPKSPVKPNTRHTNAVLNLCARARDREAMLAIAADLPSGGPGAPNHLAFTTILNALRIDAVTDLRNTLTFKQKRDNVRKALLNARHIWTDITRRWRKGDLWIDEELACAMGRLLLLGDVRDKDDILTLIEQAMNIPRQLPRFGTVARKQVEPSQQGVAEYIPPEPIQDEQSRDLIIDERSTSLEIRGQETGAYADPGNNTLSLLMETLRTHRHRTPATNYWKILTEQFGVIPDGGSYHAYLRVLRIARASAESMELVTSMPQEMVEHKTIRIAMSACRRDKNNEHSFSNAGKLLDVMAVCLRTPDIQALKIYMAVATSVAFEPTAPFKRISAPTNYDKGRQILRSLHRINPAWLNLRAVINYEEGPSKEELLDQAYHIMSLTNHMIGAYDILMDRALVPREEYSDMMRERAKLIAIVGRLKGKLRGGKRT